MRRLALALSLVLNVALLLGVLWQADVIFLQAGIIKNLWKDVQFYTSEYIRCVNTNRL